MRVRKHKEPVKEWKLGELTIQETKSYKYLGDTITNDGKNAQNIETRGNKIRASTITINTIASNEVLKKIETGVLLELHDKVNLPSLLMNAESWNLNAGEKTEIDKIEITAYLTYPHTCRIQQSALPSAHYTQKSKLTKKDSHISTNQSQETPQIGHKEP